MKINRLFVTDCSIEPDKIISWPRSLENPNFQNHKKPISNKREKDISAKSRKRVIYAYKLLYWSSVRKKGYSRKTAKSFYWRTNFITLTLSSPQEQSDKFIRKYLLEPFLRIMRIGYGMRKYIWKAETQENGRLHFHVNSDVRIPWEAIREVWNKLQDKFGMLDYYKMMFGNDSPPSTEVAAVKNPEMMYAYMAKYLAKDQKNEDGTDRRIPTCKLWDCSNNLKIEKCKIYGLEGRSENEIDFIMNTMESIDVRMKPKPFAGESSEDYEMRKREGAIVAKVYKIEDMKKFPRLSQHFRNYLSENGLIQRDIFRGTVTEFEN